MRVETFEACLFRALGLAISLIQPRECPANGAYGPSLRPSAACSARSLDRSIDGGVTESASGKGVGRGERGAGARLTWDLQSTKQLVVASPSPTSVPTGAIQASKPHSEGGGCVRISVSGVPWPGTTPVAAAGVGLLGTSRILLP